MGKTDKILVLVVDDQQESRTPLVKLLRERGFEVDEADNGRKAFTLLTRHRFSIVITDISMPNGNGVELLTKGIHPDFIGAVHPTSMLITRDSISLTESLKNP